jgi:type VI secretion system protein ImpH
MATARRRENLALSDRLFREPFRFDFFQAVRLLERLARERGDTRHVGEDRPEHEPVRFKSQPSLSFPASSIVQLRRGDPEKIGALAEMVVAFMGVTGPTGVLPYHYTALLLRRIRDKDFSLRDFLDLFHQRAISFFYRAWTKYRLPFAYERSKDDRSERDDLVTWSLYCLVGMGTPGLRRRLEFDDEAFLYYSGHFAHQPRSAVVLQAILGDYFGLPIEVLQFQGQWLQLPAGEQAIMPNGLMPLGRNNQVGISMVVGERVWDVQSKFRIRIGPLTYAQFQRFLPSGDALKPLCQLTRIYVGPELDFDVQLILRADEVPASNVGKRRTNLGWNSWTRTRAMSRDADDTVFTLDEI